MLFKLLVLFCITVCPYSTKEVLEDLRKFYNINYVKEEVVLYRYHGEWLDRYLDLELNQIHNCKRVIIYPDSHISVLIPARDYWKVENIVGKKSIIKITEEN